MAMTEDLSLFFSEEDFAVSAVHTPAGGSPAPAASVLYDANGAILEQYGVQSMQPAAVCPAAQWPTLAEGDALSITLPAGATAFRVRSVQVVDDGALKLLTLART
jgi:hypothetical protein